VLQKLSVESRARLNAAGAPALVLAHLRRVHERALADLTVRPSVAVALTALLNLSASKDCQVGLHSFPGYLKWRSTLFESADSSK
jgi:hypothetical protein